MKSLLLSFVVLFSTSTFAKQINVSGMRAKALLDIASEVDCTDAAMGGRLFTDLTKIKCEKTVDDKNEIYLQLCSFHCYDKDVVVRSDAEEHRYTTENLRAALNDFVKNEVKVSNVKKTINVTRIECKAIGLGHSLDALDIEPKYHCSVSY